MLVSAALLAVLAAFLMGVTSQTMNIWEKAQAQKSRQQTARLVLDVIARDLQSAAFPLGTSRIDALAFVVDPAGLPRDFLSPHAAFWQARSTRSPDGFADVGYFIRWRGVEAELCRLQVAAGDKDNILSRPDRALNAALLDRLAPGSSGASDSIKGLMAKNIIGLWFKLWDRAGNPLPLPYDSSQPGSSAAALVEVSVAVIDRAMVARIDSAEKIRPQSGATTTDFLQSLPEVIRPGVQVFGRKVVIHGAL